MAEIPPFTGFGPDAMPFLTGLRADNTKAYFDANRKIYDEQIALPMKSLVLSLGEQIQSQIRPGVEYEPRIGKSMFRINRDLRFSKDKTPYNTHLDAVFWEGEGTKTSPGFILRITPETTLVGTGVYGLKDQRLQRFRDAVVDDSTGAELESIVATTRKAVRGASLSEPSRKTVPKGWPKDHPRANFLKHDGIHMSAEAKTPASITSAKFVPWLVNRMAKFEPLESWLVANT